MVFLRLFLRLSELVLFFGEPLSEPPNEGADFPIQKGVEFGFYPSDTWGSLLAIQGRAHLPELFTGVDQIQDQRIEPILQTVKIEVFEQAVLQIRIAIQQSDQGFLALGISFVDMIQHMVEGGFFAVEGGKDRLVVGYPRCLEAFFSSMLAILWGFFFLFWGELVE